MKKIELALYDADMQYIEMFASYILDKKQNVDIHIFTSSESFFSDETHFDVAIISQEFDEILNFKKAGNIKKKYVLIDEFDEEIIENHIYKYQAVDEILSRIPELNSLNIRNVSEKKAGFISKIFGVYSPDSHELQLPFSMALSNLLNSKGSVLFIDLEEISILPELIDKHADKNLMDLLYEISTNNENVCFENYVHQFMGFDYIDPFINPNEISEIDNATWDRFFEMLQKTKYDTIVVLFGRTIDGFMNIIERVNKLYVLNKPGDFFTMMQTKFCDFLERINCEREIRKVVLPMSAANLTSGTYYIGELLQGNLGMFVKKLLEGEVESYE